MRTFLLYIINLVLFKKEEQDIVNALAYVMVCVYEANFYQTPGARMMVDTALGEFKHILIGSPMTEGIMRNMVEKAWKVAVKKIRADFEGIRGFGKIDIPEKCPFKVRLVGDNKFVIESPE